MCALRHLRTNAMRKFYVDQTLNQILKPLQPLSCLLTEESCHSFFFSFFLLISVGFPSGEKGSYSFLVFFLKSPWMHFPCSNCEVLQTLVLWYKHYFYNHWYSSTWSIIQENIHLDISYCCHYDSVTGWRRAGPPPGGFYLCCPVN